MSLTVDDEEDNEDEYVSSSSLNFVDYDWNTNCDCDKVYFPISKLLQVEAALTDREREVWILSITN